MDNIEIREGVASFAENRLSGLAWHNLGTRVDGAMTVEEALKKCHADYDVNLQPVVALSPDILKMMENGEMINPDMLLDLVLPKHKATMRMDENEVLGLVGNTYGVVQNVDAFKFVDLICGGGKENTPIIETCGVLGKGERVFVTAKFPTPIVLDAKRDDLLDMYMVFTTSHDGSGAVRCAVTPVRVVCQNTLALAFKNNIGRVSFRHSSNVMKRLDLFNSENAEFAFKSLNIAELYTKELKESYEHLKNIRVSEKELDNILAEVLLPTDGAKVFKETGNIFEEAISTRSRNIFLNAKNAVESGIGQDILEKGTGQWVINGLTTYYQNAAKFKNEEAKFDSLFDKAAYENVNKAYNLLLTA